MGIIVRASTRKIAYLPPPPIAYREQSTPDMVAHISGMLVRADFLPSKRGTRNGNPRAGGGFGNISIWKDLIDILPWAQCIALGVCILPSLST